MAQYPALPLFTDAYLADTRHLTAAQHGAYLLLLMTAWRMPDCKLPDDDIFLARCVAMDVRAWKANRDIVMSFWKRDEQRKWYQARLLDERKYVEDRRAKNRSNSKARWLKNNDCGHAIALPKRCQNDAPTPTPLPIINNKKIINNIYTPEFENFWNNYPFNGRSKGTKKIAANAFNKALKITTLEILLDSIRKYGEYLHSTGEYNADASTWLKQQRWENDFKIPNAPTKEQKIDYSEVFK